MRASPTAVPYIDLIGTRLFRKRQALAVGLWKLISISLMVFAHHEANAQEAHDRVARIAEIEIDPQQVEAYRTALREEIEASIRLEPGVLTLEAVSVKDHPEQVRIFEIYLNQAAYESHLHTAHFNKYKATTQAMVRSLKLIEADPILLGAKK
jgi:quinol monooxygenase YgiN